MLLKHFVDDNDQLSFFERNEPSKGVRRQTPRTLFVKKHLYTFTDLVGNKDFSTEEFFNDLETKNDPLICKIVENARNGLLPRLNLAERAIWDWFIMTLWKRLPDVCEEMMPRLLADEGLRRRFRDCVGIAASKPINLAAMRRFIWKEAWPRSLQERDQLMESEVLPTLSWMNLWVAVVPIGQAGLIVGSNPVIRIPGNTPHLRDPETEVILALAHDVAVCFNHSSQEAIYELKPRDVRDFNRAVFDKSTIVAGRSNKQLRSLAKKSNLKKAYKPRFSRSPLRRPKANGLAGVRDRDC